MHACRHAFCRADGGGRALWLLADTDGGEQYKRLCGLPILPTADGGYQTIRPPVKTVKGSLLVGTPEEVQLLELMAADVVEPGLPSGVLEHLRSEAMVTYTNVRVLTPELLAGCLHRVLPEGWEGIEEVQWRVGKDGQPDALWMRRFWEYASEERLAAFQRWPLLPTCEGTLCAVRDGESKVLDGTSALGDRIKSVLSRLGVRMLDADYVSRRERLAHLVHRPDLRGVLRALGVANQGSFQQLVKSVQALSAADKRELREFLLQKKWLTQEACSEEAALMILALPLHEICGPGVEDELFAQVDGQKLPPPGSLPSLLTEAFLKAAEAEAEAYRFLGVETARLSSFYIDAVFPRLGKLDVDASEEAMLGMLGQLPQLCREDPRFWDRLSNLAFVKTAAGQLARPWELYDPSVSELEDLLQGGEFYPAPSFLKPEYIATLVRLGLQTSLDRAGILKVARSIASSLDNGVDPAQVSKRGRSLLTFLARQASALGLDKPADVDDPLLAQADEAFREQLRSLAWVPVRQDRPRDDIPWVPGRKVVAAPNHVRLASDVMYASHSMATCAEEVKSKALCAFLGWCDPVSPVVLALQLVQYAAMHGQELAVNPLEQPMEERVLPADVRETVLSIYGMLSAQAAAEQFDTVKLQLRGQACVLIGESFVACDHVALRCDSEAAPLLHALPEDLEPYQDLFVQLGVRERFERRDYVAALERLARSNRGQTLEPEQLTLAARLAKEAAQFKAGHADKGGLWLPDAAGEMTQVQCLVYDDAPWLSSTLKDVQFLHKDIDNDVAEALGLRSVRKLLISGELHMRDLACPSPEWVRQQLRFSPDRRQLPAHLVDFADSLGARHVHILFDFRTHHAQSVLQPNLASLQGPAVVVYLEGLKMSAEELCRLQNLPLHKQGLRRPMRVGAGLNSIYLATDVPCIISGEGFFFFDPKGSHFVDADQKQARPVGKAHIFVNSDMPNKFADQFEPFKVFGFDANRHFPGTLIRLPLKVSPQDGPGDDAHGFEDAREEGEQSGGSDDGADSRRPEAQSAFDQRMSEEDLEDMLACCSKLIGPECLLFLENVESVEVSSWREVCAARACQHAAPA